jgi:hypothetical protein
MNSSTWLALIALKSAELPNPVEVAERCNAAAPDSAPLEISSRTDSMVTFQWGEATIAYTLVDRPIPAAQLAGPAARAWYWPEAEAALAQHTAHLIVALVDESRDRIAKCIKLTRFVAALLPESCALGLQWGGSRAVHEPSAFCQVAEHMSRDDMPLHLWVEFQIESNDHGGLRLYTTGLAPFGKREIEIPNFPGSPQDLMAHAYNLAHYLLEKDANVKDGAVIGLPGEIQATARDTTTFLGGDEPVLAFEFT